MKTVMGLSELWREETLVVGSSAPNPQPIRMPACARGGAWSRSTSPVWSLDLPLASLPAGMISLLTAH